MNLVSDVFALLCSAIGLTIGLRLAYFGRLARGRWARIVEAIVVFVLASIVANLVGYLFTRPALYPQIGAAFGLVIGAIAYYLSGRYESQIWGVVGAAIAAAIALVIAMFFPGFDLIGLGGIAVIVAAYLGYLAGLRSHRIMLVIGTAISGAQLTSTSVVGLVQVVLNDSAGYLQDRLFDFVAPLVSPMVSLIKAMLSQRELALLILGIAVLVVVLGTGIAYQFRKINLNATLPRNFREWIIEPLQRKAPYIIFVAIVYVVVLAYVRIGVLDKPTDRPTSTVPTSFTTRPSTMTSSGLTLVRTDAHEAARRSTRR